MLLLSWKQGWTQINLQSCMFQLWGLECQPLKSYSPTGCSDYDAWPGLVQSNRNNNAGPSLSVTMCPVLVSLSPIIHISKSELLLNVAMPHKQCLTLSQSNLLLHTLWQNNVSAKIKISSVSATRYTTHVDKKQLQQF